MDSFVWLETLEKTQIQPVLRIRGIAVKAGVSRNYNVYIEEELKKAVQSLVGQPVYIEHVSADKAVGKVVNAWWDDKEKAIMYEAEIYDDEVANKIKTGLIQHVSIAANYELIEPVNGRIPRGLGFKELSLVAVPGVPETNIQVLEKLFEKVNTYKTGKEVDKKLENQVKEKVVKHTRNYDKAPEDTEWSFTADDGNFILDKGGWELYREAHVWYDPEKADVKAGYKLPHHKFVGGRFSVVWRGVAAAMAALFGARGGVDIPDEDRKGVYNHLAQHYREFEREPPTFESATIVFKLEDLNERMEKLVDEVERLSVKVNTILESLLPKTRKIRIKT
ncbi:MAG: hypothetical protein ACKD6N_03510 [Candidatus Bathyarchaeota archaeon]